MTRSMVELTKDQCKQVTGGSGLINAGGRSEDTTTTSSTDRSGYISAGGRTDTTTTSTDRSGYIHGGG